MQIKTSQNPEKHHDEFSEYENPRVFPTPVVKNLAFHSLKPLRKTDNFATPT